MDVAMVWRRAVFGHRFRRRSRRRPCPPISGPSHRPRPIRTSRRARGLVLPPSSRYPRLGPQALAQQRPRSSRQRRLSRQPLPREPSRKAPRLNRWLLRPRPPRAVNRRLRPSRFRRTPPHRPRPRSRQRRRLSRRLLRLEPSRKAPRLNRWLLRPRPPRAANRRLRPSRFRRTPPHRPRPRSRQRRRLSRRLLRLEASRRAPRLIPWLPRPRPPRAASRRLRPSRFRRTPPHRPRPRSRQRRRLSRRLLRLEASRRAPRLIPWLPRPRPPRAASRRLRPSRFRRTPPHRPRPRSRQRRRLSRRLLRLEPSRTAPRLNRWLLRPRPPRAANRCLRPSRFRRTPPHRPRPRSRQRRRLSRRLLRLEPSRKAPRLNRWLLRPRPPRAANRCLRPSRFRHTRPHRPTGCQRRRLSRQLLPREPSRKAPRLNRWLLRRRPPWVANRYLRPSRFRRIPPHRPRSCQRRRLSRQLLLREPSRKATRRRPCQSNRNPLLSSTHRRLRQLSAHRRRQSST